MDRNEIAIGETIPCLYSLFCLYHYLSRPMPRGRIPPETPGSQLLANQKRKNEIDTIGILAGI